MSLPGRFIPRITGWANFILDNSTHFTVFFVLALLLTKGLRKARKVIFKKPFLGAILICFTYGIILEVIQIPIPERAFEWSDVIANLTGAVVGAVVVRFFGSSGEIG